MSETEGLGIQFQDLQQQRLAATQGMWIFLATEALFFGALFVAYAMLRMTYPDAFRIASHEMSLAYGTVNTLVLVTSSSTMVQAVRAAEEGRRKRLVATLLLTAALGIAFLVIKGFEYAYDFRHHSLPDASMRIEGHAATPPMHLFMFFYWIMTGFHAIHLLVGIALVGGLAARAFLTETFRPASVEVVGLYWNFVDIVWLFLFPSLYLAGAGLR